jgi:L-ascorbate metabolism protein UlaG (beta-lactamase superfamily)
MKTRLNFILLSCTLAIILLESGRILKAQDVPRITKIQRLASKEIVLDLSATAGLNYRIDVSTNLTDWISLMTVRSTGSIQHTDAAAPNLGSRFYRALPIIGTPLLTGEHLVTTNGEVVIQPLFHATFVMSWNGKVIYNDPASDSAFNSRYQGLPKADLILVSHSHGDHFSSAQIEAVRGPNAVIIVPQLVYNGLTTAQKALAIVLRNGASTNVMGLAVEAVPAYNSNHPKGDGNGYVVTIGGKRLYMAGDTGTTAEMNALKDIDVAFLCVNVPYTMTVSEAVAAVRAFRPQVVYPYHFRNQTGTLSDLDTLKKQVGTDLGIEVRARKWY